MGVNCERVELRPRPARPGWIQANPADESEFLGALTTRFEGFCYKLNRAGRKGCNPADIGVFSV